MVEQAPGIAAIIPIKNLADSKTRLSPKLSPERRAKLVLGMLSRVIAAIQGSSIDQFWVVGGDGRHFSIAAASILAKTHRDRLMESLDRQYPGYGLARHKGYSTAEHQQAISRLGPCPIHRTSYAFIDELTGAYSATFYQLKSELRSVSCSAELQVCRGELARSRGSLPQNEIRKLHLLINRQLKRYPPARQLKLGSGF